MGDTINIRTQRYSAYHCLAKFLADNHDNHGFGDMTRAQREIIHVARLIEPLEAWLAPKAADRYLIRDAQRVIEVMETLVRIHTLQEEGLYEHAVSGHR